MDDNIKSIRTDLFYKIRSRFTGLKLGEESGQITINPEDAVFFDFDYTEGEVPLGHVSISLAEPASMKIYYSTNIAEGMSTVQKDNWYGFLRGLRVARGARLRRWQPTAPRLRFTKRRPFQFSLTPAIPPGRRRASTIVAGSRLRCPSFFQMALMVSIGTAEP